MTSWSGWKAWWAVRSRGENLLVSAAPVWQAPQGVQGFRSALDTACGKRRRGQALPIALTQGLLRFALGRGSPDA